MMKEVRDAENSDDDFLLDDENISDELINFATDFHRDIVLWAGPQVLRAYTEFRMAADKKTGGHASVLSMDKVLKAMRSDLGLSNFGLSEGDIISIFLKDPKEINNSE